MWYSLLLSRPANGNHWDYIVKYADEGLAIHWFPCGRRRGEGLSVSWFVYESGGSNIHGIHQEMGNDLLLSTLVWPVQTFRFLAVGCWPQHERV